MKRLMSLSVIFLYLTACSSTNNVTPSNSNTVDINKVSEVITQKCASCHSTKTKALKGVSYDSYDDMVKGVSGIKRTVVIQRSMPEGSITMTEEERSLIKQWADQISK